MNREELMSSTKLSLERPRVICHVDASSKAAAVVKAAGSYCRERHAELVVVRVLEPSSYGPSLPFPDGGTGTWGLLGAAAAALELAHEEGVTVRAVVRIGDAGRVLEEERRAVGAERVFTGADVASVGRAVVRRTSREPRAA